MLEAELIEAAKVGDLAAIRRLDAVHGKYLKINCRCPQDGSTPLYIAACNGKLLTCDWLIRHGAKPEYPTKKSGSIPLHGAAARGQCYCVRLLIKSSPGSVNARTRINGDTALHLASYRGHVDVCRILLAHGASIELINSQGRTALDEARTASHYEIFYMLLNHRPAPGRCLRRSEESRSEEILGCDRHMAKDKPTERKMITEPVKVSEDLTSTRQSTLKDTSSSLTPTGLHNCQQCSCHYNPRIEDFSFCRDHIKPILQSPDNATTRLNGDVILTSEQKHHSVSNHSSQIVREHENDDDIVAFRRWSTSDIFRVFDLKMNDLERYLKTVHANQSLNDRRISELENQNSSLMKLLANADVTKKELEASRALAVSYIERATRAERDLNAVSTVSK